MPEAKTRPEEMVNVATIINTRGLKGECKLYLHTDEDEERFQKGNVLLLDGKTPLTVKSYSVYKSFGYVFFEEIPSIEQAEKLKNHKLLLKKEDLPQADENEYYYHELSGCQVVNEEGKDLGTVSDILETGANLVLRVKEEGAEKTWLLPFVDAFVIDVDRKDKKIIIREMEGLR
jgi:16S rRNA processing protein RimM